MANTHHFAQATMAAAHVQQVQPVAPPASGLDALSTSLAAQANAISMQSNAMAAQSLWLTALGVVLALGAILAGIAWARFVKASAQDAAQDAAKDWMNQNAEQIIAKLDAEIRARGAESKPAAEAQAADLAAEGG